MEINDGDTVMLITPTHVLVVNIQSIKLRKDFNDNIKPDVSLVEVSIKSELDRS